VRQIIPHSSFATEFIPPVLIVVTL